MTLDTLKIEIEKLSPADRAQLATWLSEQQDAAWDQQIRGDFRTGKLDRLIKQAQREMNDGTIREAP
jgi:hypothetical protein